MSPLHERAQDAAIARFVSALALCLQMQQLLLERLQLMDAGMDTGQMCLDQVVGVFAGHVRIVGEFAQTLRVGERHVERAAVANEAQRFQMVFAVGAVARVGPRRGRQEAGTLVIADRFDIGTRRPGQFSDFHA